MRLFAIDPGLDTTGVAIFDVDRFHDLGGSILAVYKALVGTIAIKTTVNVDLHLRLGDLAHDLGAVLDEHAGDGERPACYIERAAYEGDYGGDKARRSSVNRYFEARGALLSEIGRRRIPTCEIKAGQSSKEYRAEILEREMRAAGLKLPTGPRGGRRLDEWDAMWVGRWVLTNTSIGETADKRSERMPPPFDKVG